MVRDGVEVVILIPRTFWGEKAYSAFKETIGEKLSETNITAHTAVPELGIKTGDGHAWKLEFTANENSFNQLIKSLESKKRPDIGHSL
jgi:hypothetical protein